LAKKGFTFTFPAGLSVLVIEDFGSVELDENLNSSVAMTEDSIAEQD
jgi:hypothetical protein